MKMRLAAHLPLSRVSLGIAMLPSILQAHQAGPSTQEQSAEAPREAYTLRVSSQRVMLDTVVRDRNGNVIRNLKQDDFTILEDSVPQNITAFEVTDTTKPGMTRKAIHSTEELEKVAPKSPVTILVLDELATEFEDEYFARYSLKRYLDRQGETLNEPTLLLARTYNRTMVLHDYTTSKAAVLDALDRHMVGNDWRAKDPSQADTLLGAAFASLIEVAKATEGHAGHKNLIWIGRGFPSINRISLTADRADALDTAAISCSNLLREARITLDALDPSGVSVPLESTMDSNGDLTPADLFGGEIDFDKIAESTGGVAMHGRNDVDRMIDQAVEGGELFYTLAYRPASHSGLDPKKFHRIKIVMKDTHLIATSREGYYAELPENTDKDPAAGDVAHARMLDLAGATSGLMVFTEIPLEVVRKEQTNQYEVTFPVAAAHLEEKSGKLAGDADLLVVSFDRKGKILSSSGRVISLHLPELPQGKIEDRKVTVTTTVNAVGAPARIRFVVRAHSNGNIGAENYFLVDRNLLRDPSTGEKEVKP